MSLDRREFVTALLLSGAAATVPAVAVASTGIEEEKKNFGEQQWNPVVDFRYAPHESQSTICFPDDPQKSVVGQAGDLRYGFARSLFVGMEDFSTIVEFSLAGFEDDKVVRQWIETPGAPIVHTLVEREAAEFELIAFASRHGEEGRVDNVLITIRAKKGPVAVMPKLRVRTCEKLELEDYKVPMATVRVKGQESPLFVGAQVGSNLGTAMLWEEEGYTIYLPHGETAADKPARYFVRLPQEHQAAEKIVENLQNPEMLLEEARAFWSKWKAFGETSWSYPARHGEFLTGCARNIQQAREVKDGHLVFQVGPTVYRGMWIVDGNFLLEAARYLGYDREAEQGLRSEWTKQVATGQVIASGGGEHWKDTAIAMFTLVRQCELSQDWSLFHELEPNVLKAIDFLIGLRDEARKGTSTNGHYGLLAPGFADGGLSGVRSEFTNTVWTLAGLHAVADAAQQQKMPALAKAGTFFDELYAAFQAMVKQEMVRHPDGFEYLPMVAHDDPLLREPDPWNRPRPQTAQWAMSHAIYPGLVFAKEDAIVKGHIALLQACTREDVPAETGWLWHDALWNYNASFAAHVYLWAGLDDWAHRTFTGFLNHASPLYCWREEQPLQNALVGQDWGDMPHNWASAECVRYLRHMLALEDGKSLRLLDGMTAAELKPKKPYLLKKSPTRFGRIDLSLEPGNGSGWRVRFARDGGPNPARVTLPGQIGSVKFQRASGAVAKSSAKTIEIDPNARNWEAWFQ